MTRHLLVAAVTALALPAAAPAAPSPRHTLDAAAEVLDELAAIPNRGIPAELLAQAEGVAIIPRVIKAGFVVGGRGGHGVVLTRDRNGGWGDPTFVNFGGASVGLQAGVQATDVVLVFRTRKSLDRILDGKGKITLGADAAVAAGPLGRQAAAGTDAKLQAEILSYSRSRGLFAGVALDGAVIRPDPDVNAEYRRDARPETRRAAEAVMLRLAQMSGAAADPRPVGATRDLPPRDVPPAVPNGVPPAVPDRP